VSDPSKFFTTCARHCEARAYQITVRQQAAKISELETRLQIDTLNPNRREHIVQQAAKIAELEKERDLMLYEVANQYDGNDLNEMWSIGANHVFKLFAKWVFDKRAKALKDQG
jgi:hypothetical protein